MLAWLISKLLISGVPPTSASQSAGSTGVSHYASLYSILVETEFCHVGQADLELLISGDPPASASQSAWITGVSHRVRPINSFCTLNVHSFFFSYLEKLDVMATF